MLQRLLCVDCILLFRLYLLLALLLASLFLQESSFILIGSFLKLAFHVSFLTHPVSSGCGVRRWFFALSPFVQECAPPSTSRSHCSFHAHIDLPCHILVVFRIHLPFKYRTVLQSSLAAFPFVLFSLAYPPFSLLSILAGFLFHWLRFIHSVLATLF